jgi:hypothetical protein
MKKYQTVVEFHSSLCSLKYPTYIHSYLSMYEWFKRDINDNKLGFSWFSQVMLDNWAFLKLCQVQKSQISKESPFISQLFKSSNTNFSQTIHKTHLMQLPRASKREPSSHSPIHQHKYLCVIHRISLHLPFAHKNICRESMHTIILCSWIRCISIVHRFGSVGKYSWIIEVPLLCWKEK